MSRLDGAWESVTPAALLDPQALRARLVRLAAIAFGGLAAVAVAWQALPGSRAALVHVTPTLIPAYLALLIIVVALAALRWRCVLKSVGVSLPLTHLMRLWMGARAVGSLIPSGTLAGEPVRAYLLRGNAVPLTLAAGAVAVDRTLELAGNMIAGPVCIVTALALGAGSLPGALVAMLTAGAGLTVLVFVYGRAARGAPALVALLGPAARREGALASVRCHAEKADAALRRLVATHPRLVPAGVGLSLVIESVQLVELALLYAAFGLSVPLPLLLLSSVGIGVARVVPISASLGSLEATQIGIFAIGGRTAGLGLSVGLVLRLAETFRILVGLACLVLVPGLGPLGPRRARVA